MTELEWQTRKTRIDTRLKALSPAWRLVAWSETLETTALDGVAVTEYPTDSGPADYALFARGRLLGIIEAKKVGTGPENVLEQAKRYARTVTRGVGNWRGYRVPFLFSTNGEKIFFLDTRRESNLSREVAEFFTAEGLVERFEREDDSAWFAAHSLTDAKLRDYQKEAIEATEAALAAGDRAMLLAMATGTGKTFTTVTQIYRLLESKQFKRILFLVDRRALAMQAVREFAAYATPHGNKFTQEYEVYHQQFRREDYDEAAADDKPFDPKILPTEYLTRPDATKTFVYISTIQRMTINLFGAEHAYAQAGGDPDYEPDAAKLAIPIHAFDLIIADECHRGYTAGETGIWRDTLNHFDAVKIGLTATPAAHTLALFKKVIYRYTTEQAVLAGYLCDFDPIRVRSEVRIKGAFLKEGEQVGVVDTETGREILDQLEDEREFATGEIEKKITAPKSNQMIIEEIAKHALAHEQETGRFPKTLIFADNDLPHTSHADQLVRLCREVFARGDDFVQKITGSPSVDRPLQRIREFRNRPDPKIVVTVDMLSTGVDIPALEFIVFLRPVKSRILWVQMLGRGTRLCPDINKEKFVVFDCFDGTLFEYFRNATDLEAEPPQREPLAIAQVIENIYQNIDREYHTRVLVKRLRRIGRTMSAEAREQFALFIPVGDLDRYADALPRQLKTDFTGTMALLRDPKFQELLVTYPRAKRSFLKAYELDDTVSSAAMNGGAYGRPEDYLDSFVRFVKENPEQIEAIRILLERPREWNTRALDELRRKLAQNRFAEKELQKAHHLVYHKALADIISMVKHAAKTGETILTAEERVDRALARVTGGKEFTPEQEQWLGYIRDHLVRNLTIELDDFDHQPVFEQRGGLRRARMVFARRLEPLVAELNAAVAA